MSLTGVEPVLRFTGTKPSTWRVYQFHHRDILEGESSSFPGRNRTYAFQVQGLTADASTAQENIGCGIQWDYSESNRGILGFNQTLYRLSYNPNELLPTHTHLSRVGNSMLLRT